MRAFSRSPHQWPLRAANKIYIPKLPKIMKKIADQSGSVSNANFQVTSAQSPFASNMLGHHCANGNAFKNFSSGLMPHSNASGKRTSHAWRKATAAPENAKAAIKPPYIPDPFARVE